MAKKGVSRITGNTSPKTGEKALYKVTEWYPGTPANERKESLVTWELFRKRPDGKFTSTNIKKKVGEFTFGKDAWQYTYRVEGYLDKPEGKDPMSIIVQPQKNEQQPSAEKKILDVKLTFQDGTPVNKKLSYQDRLWAIAKCQGMEGEHIIFTLWEDDERGDGHNKKNQSIVKSPPVLVDSQGNARWNFALLSTYIAIANQREDDKKQHEYYVTAEYNGKLKASDNANANNPEYKAPPAPPKKPAGGTGGTSQPKPAPPKPQPNSPKGSTRPNSPNNQPDKKGEITLVKLTDKNGKEFSKNPKFGETIIVHIESKNLKGKKYTLNIWEHDTIGKDDLLYSHEHTFLGDKINLSMPLTAAMQKTGEIGNDPKNPDSGEYYWKGGQQEIFAEVIYIDISAKSKIIDVGIMEAPKPQNNGNTATGVKNEPKPDTKAGGCPNCDKPVNADDLKTIFPNASEANRKLVADTYTKYMKDLGMNTCWNKAHFFAQARVEAGDALNLKEGEGFNYYWESIIGTFKAFQTKEGREKAKLWGRAIRDRKDPKAVDVPVETQIKIANYAYSPPAAKAKELENTEPNDGWNYRGRGLIQVTGKGFYKYCNPYTLKYNNIDVLKNPDAIGERIDLCVSSGMIFFKWKKINELANKTRDVKGKICPLVGNDVIRNGVSKNHQPKQDAFDTITSKVFKIDQCTINNDKKSTPQTNGKWRMPIDNPMLCLYSQGGAHKPWHGSFGEKIRDGSANHTGCDLLAVPGTKVYACFKGKISKIYTSGSMAGNVVVIEVLDKETFKSLQNKSYQPTYKNKGEILERGFNHNGTIYLTFWHLSKNDFFKEGDPVEYDDVIGLTGISGWGGKNFTTRNPHLHFEVSNVGSAPGLNGKCNPAMYFHFKTENELSKNEIDFQNKLKEKEWK